MKLYRQLQQQFPGSRQELRPGCCSDGSCSIGARTLPRRSLSSRATSMPAPMVRWPKKLAWAGPCRCSGSDVPQKSARHGSNFFRLTPTRSTPNGRKSGSTSFADRSLGVRVDDDGGHGRAEGSEAEVPPRHVEVKLVAQSDDGGLEAALGELLGRLQVSVHFSRLGSIDTRNHERPRR